MKQTSITLSQIRALNISRLPFNSFAPTREKHEHCGFFSLLLPSRFLGWNTKRGRSCRGKGNHLLPSRKRNKCVLFIATQGFQIGCTVVVFHDVWGHIPRFKSICDTFAEQGKCHVIAPDCFRGTIKADADAEKGNMFDWLKSHPYDEMINGDIRQCLQYMEKEKGVEAFGALGFCWGAWAIAKAAGAGVDWKAGVSPHPSLKCEELFGRDQKEMVSKVRMPFLLLPGSNEPENVKPGGELIQILEKQGGKAIVFEDMLHGWTTRSDLTDANTKAQVEKALSLSLEFMMEHLQ